MTPRYHDDEQRLVRAKMLELVELRAELAVRKRGCSCRWEPKPGLIPNPGCPTHGVEATDLLTLGRAARDAALQVLTAGQVTRSARRSVPQSASVGPVPDRDDPLRHIAVGDPDPTPDSPARLCGQTRWLADLGSVWCTRMPHPDRWLHIAGDGERILAVWTDDATVADR